MDKKSPPITIVLAEDDPTIAMAYTHGLGFYEFSVIHARDGKEALAAIDQSMPDILLLDVIMPNMNGIEVLEAIRSRKELAKLPVIVLTNLGQPSDADRVLELGAKAYLIKANLSLQDLIQHIHDALGTAP
jgi:two-component system sensor histidine kinase ChiS